MVKLMKRVLALVMICVCTAGFALPACAQATLDDILKRVEALEKENASLKAEVMALKEKPAAPVQVAAVPAAAPASAGNFLKTKLDMELYGFIKADAVYSDSEAATNSTTNSSVAAYNAPYNGIKKHQHDFNLSGQATRLGINFNPVALDNGGKVGGKFEMDWNATNGPVYQPRLRLAYLQADYDKWGVTAGQAWDFFAPINANTLNDANVWRAGNIGYRHPQVYLTNKWGDVLGGKLNTKVGIMDSDDPYQENSGIPVAGVFAGYDTKIAGMASSFNVGGVWGQNSTDLLGTADRGKSNDIYGVVLGSTVKMTDQLSLKAKGFTGAKLDDFMGGTSTGLSNLTVASSKGLRVIGGFTELCYVPIKKLETNFGLGLDALATPKENVSQENVGSQNLKTMIWTSNRTYYTNMKYSLSKDLLVGVEYQHFDTHWVGGADSSDNRVESSVILKF
jgi:hypothetical protein